VQVAGIAARLANLQSPSPTTKRARTLSGLALAVGPAFGPALSRTAVGDHHTTSPASPITTHGGWHTAGADARPLASPTPSPLVAQGSGVWPPAATTAAPCPPSVPLPSTAPR
jgi:hypothetical protein